MVQLIGRLSNLPLPMGRVLAWLGSDNAGSSRVRRITAGRMIAP